MSSLKNPYLSLDSQNLLLRKNYKVIQSSSKEKLFPSYDVKRQNFYSSKETLYNNKNHQFTISTTEFSSSSNLRNPFSTKALGQRNQNYTQSFTNLPSFHTQPYLPSIQKKQLPFPSYNRPQSNNRIGSSFSSSKVTNVLSLSRRNLAVSNVKISSTQSLQKNLPLTTTPYRPHFVSPTSRTLNNQWNTQKWKRQLQLKQRERLEKYGPQSLRYDGGLLNGQNIHRNNSNVLNNEYYSTSSLQQQLYKISVQRPPRHHQLSKGKNVVLFDQQQQQQHQNEYQQSQVKGYFFRYNNNKNNNNNNNKNNNNKNDSNHNYQTTNNNNSSQSSTSLTIPNDPGNYFHNNRRKQVNNIDVKKFSDIKQQSYISNIQSKIKPQKLFTKNQVMINGINSNNNDFDVDVNVNVDVDVNVDDNINDSGNPQQQFMSKYSQNNFYRQKQYKSKGPLDLDAFDSVVHNENKQQNLQQKKSQVNYQFGTQTFGGYKTKNDGFNQQGHEKEHYSQSPKGKKNIIIVKNNNNKTNITNIKKPQQKNTLLNLKTKMRVDNSANNNNTEFPTRKLQFRNKLYYLIKFN